MKLHRPWHSMAFRLALYYGGLLLITLVVVLAIFYVQMVGVLHGRMDQQARNNLKRLQQHAQQYGEAALQRELQYMLEDGVDSQTEIVILTTAEGQYLMGNATVHPHRVLSTLGLRELQVLRADRLVQGKVAVARLPSGHVLIVGSDLNALRDIEQRFVRASLLAVILVVVLAITGSIGFRRMVEERATSIRRTLQQVENGLLHERVALSAHEDEFTRLGSDINKMLDQVEQLMEGVKHVSNTIAHNLRTPLTRILLQLRSAHHLPTDVQRQVLTNIEHEAFQLGTVFDKLLQLAELESGMRRQQFAAVDVAALLTEITELYEPVIEDQDATLSVHLPPHCHVQGDADLLASALANVLENALKYACHAPGGALELRAYEAAGQVHITLSDNGPGVPPDRLPHLTDRFYRVHEREPGQGLGLSSVQAIVQLHDGQLHFANLHPGLAVTMRLPVAAQALSRT